MRRVPDGDDRRDRSGIGLGDQPRTLAVVSFSWWPTAGRVERAERRLLATLADHGIEAVAEPFLLGYDAPWTPPFLRTNEVAVEVRSGE